MAQQAQERKPTELAKQSALAPAFQQNAKDTPKVNPQTRRFDADLVLPGYRLEGA